MQMFYPGGWRVSINYKNKTDVDKALCWERVNSILVRNMVVLEWAGEGVVGES